jgi:N-acyl-D-amino-acid deacylase
MHDIVIRGGTIVDGSGKLAFTGDLAIDGERIVAVGGKAGLAKRDIDAKGLLVTPGWIDGHTHYDGQVTWDPMLIPSSNNGVTTVLFGNCGVGFAPAKREDRELMVLLMEGVEEIPREVLHAGLRWDWQSFPEYLDALERLPRVIDVASQLPHNPLRVFVMGERGLKREKATPDDIAAMKRLTAEALRAGAFGFTTTRRDGPRTPDGEPMPSRFASNEELLGIGSALGEVGVGVFGLNSEFTEEEEEFAWIEQQAKDSRRPVYFSLSDRPRDPQRWRRLMGLIEAARKRGNMVTAQVHGRPVGVLLGIGTHMNPFSIRQSYHGLEDLPLTERLVRLRDPEVKRRILADQPAAEKVNKLNPLSRSVTEAWDRMFVMGDPLDFEPPQENTVAAIAAREGKTPEEVAYDYLTAAPDHFLFFPVSGYVGATLESIHQMITAPAAIIGLDDAGAHCSSIVDATLATYLLTHWVRDRSRGPRLSLEFAVKSQTGDLADYFGFKDRGVLRPGLKADINLIDLDGLRLRLPEIVHDLPASGRRLVQRSDGYHATLVAGVPIFEKGEHTGTLPGRVVRCRN